MNGVAESCISSADRRDCTLLPLVSRIIVLERGRVVMDGPRDKVLAALSGKEPRGPLNVVTGGVKE